MQNIELGRLRDEMLRLHREHASDFSGEGRQIFVHGFWRGVKSFERVATAQRFLLARAAPDRVAASISDLISDPAHAPLFEPAMVRARLAF